MTKRMLKTTLLIAIAALIFPSFSNGQDVVRTTYGVKNVTCGSCLSRIGNELSRLQGAIAMEADLGKGIVRITHASELPSEKIGATIASLGFPTEIIGVDEAPLEAEGINAAAGNNSGTTGEILNRTVLAVRNLTCGACVVRIESGLRGLPGVTGMRADLARGIVYVDHDKRLSGAEIASAVDEAGYPAEVHGTGDIHISKSFSFGGQRGGGCGGGCNSSGCGASASAWRKIYEKYLASQK